MALRLEENGNVQKIFRDNTLEGTIIRHAADNWEYINCIGRKGTAQSERAAFVNLGFFKGKRPPLEIGKDIGNRPKKAKK